MGGGDGVMERSVKFVLPDPGSTEPEEEKD
jgi:hypothetical protein